MENLNGIKQEFWQIKIHIDRGNPRPNMKTELYFEFRNITGGSLELIARTLPENQSLSFVVLCRFKSGNRWEATEESGFFLLKEFCGEWLSEQEDKNLQDARIRSDVALELRRILAALFDPNRDS